jgi:hypothetical protein
VNPSLEARARHPVARRSRQSRSASRSRGRRRCVRHGANKIACPNGKICVGQDLPDSANYFGSASSNLIAADFTPDELGDLAIRREILWQSATTSKSEVTAVEKHYILKLRSNGPSVGYDRWPRISETGDP